MIERRTERIPTVDDAAEATIALRRKNWSSGGSVEASWRRTLRRHVLPQIGSMRVTDVGVRDVLRILEGVRARYPKSVSTVRERVEALFNWTVASDYRTDNPASGDVLRQLLRTNSLQVDHHAALAPRDVGAALRAVRACENAWPGTALCLEFLVLTAVRNNEARGALWSQIDPAASRWTMPKHRMKARSEHLVPLSSQALECLRAARRCPRLAQARASSGNFDVVFPSRHGRELFNNALAHLCGALDIGARPHGFRTSFRQWCADREVEFVVAEVSLAHAHGTSSSKPYDRGDYYDRRVPVMQNWGDYVLPPGQ